MRKLSFLRNLPLFLAVSSLLAAPANVQVDTKTHVLSITDGSTAIDAKAIALTLGGFTISDAAGVKTVVLGNTSGVQFGATGNKIAFLGAVPIVRPIGTTDLRVALINLGLYATGGASPLNLNGGTLTAGVISGSNETLSGTFGVTGNTAFGGTVGITGATTASSLALSGNETIGGTLLVTGATTQTGPFSGSSIALSGNEAINGTLNITGATSGSSFSFTGNGTIGGTFGVTGASTFNALAATTGTFSGALSASAVSGDGSGLTGFMASQVPPLDWSKITTGKPTTIGGYGINDFNSLGDARWTSLTANQTITGAKLFDAGTGYLGVRSNVSAFPSSDNGSNALLAIGANYSGSASEIDFVNTNATLRGGFRFFDKTGSSTAEDIFWIRSAGLRSYLTNPQQLIPTDTFSIGSFGYSHFDLLTTWQETGSVGLGATLRAQAIVEPAIGSPTAAGVGAIYGGTLVKGIGEDAFGILGIIASNLGSSGYGAALWAISREDSGIGTDLVRITAENNIGTHAGNGILINSSSGANNAVLNAIDITQAVNIGLRIGGAGSTLPTTPIWIGDISGNLLASVDNSGKGTFFGGLNVSGNGNIFFNSGNGYWGSRGSSLTLPPSDDGTNAVFAQTTNFSNGLSEIDNFNTVNSGGGFRFLQKTGPATKRDLMWIDGDNTSGNTPMLLWDATSGTLKRVSVGAADSGGTGYRVLRVPN